MRVTSIDIEVTPVGVDEARQSISSVFDALLASHARLHRVAEALPDILHDTGDGSCDLLIEGADLFRVKAVNGTTLGAGNGLAVLCLPSKRHLELCSAVARDINARPTFTAHGWPILSVVARTDSLAEAGGAASTPGGGLPA